MSSVNFEEDQLTLCPFDQSFNTKTQYVCFKYEKCCPQGCCYMRSATYFQTWCIWLAIVLLFTLFYVACWYFKKVNIDRLRTVRARNMASSRQSSAPPSPRRQVELEDRLLERLMQTRRARSLNRPMINQQGKYLDPPPRYGDAVNMPRSGRNVQQAVEVQPSGSASTAGGADETGNPPTYEDATKSQEDEV